MALVFDRGAVLAPAAVRARSVTVPAQLLSVLGHSTVMLTVPEELARRVVLASLASGTAAALCS